jgi:hypothetical protein
MISPPGVCGCGLPVSFWVLASEIGRITGQRRFRLVGSGVVGGRKTDPRRRERASATSPAGSGARKMLPFSRRKRSLSIPCLSAIAVASSWGKEGHN